MSQRRRKRTNEEHEERRGWSRGRIAAMIFCVILAGYFFFLAHQLETDPAAEARFARDPDADPLSRASVPDLQKLALGLCAAALLIAFVARP